MKPASKTAKSGPLNSEFVQQGLRAHRMGTKKVCEEERRMEIRRDPAIISAIRNRTILKFIYNGTPRVVEPQTYGLSKTGKEVLRAYQVSGESRAGVNSMPKLFDLSKITALERTHNRFAEAFPAHNLDDSAMVEVFATLAKPKAKAS